MATSSSSKYYNAIMSPVKMVLPGIIVSLVGGAAGFFIFNNPVKIKARSTYATWNVITEYEKMFARNVEDAYCTGESLDQLRFRKDYSHQLDIIIQNMQDLKEEGNTDKRLNAVLNVKIARYGEAKKITEDYLDKILPLTNQATLNTIDSSLINKIKLMQENYMEDLAHIETRDTNMIKDIALQLTQSYKKYTQPFAASFRYSQDINEIKKYIIGNWHMVELGAKMNLKADSSGAWEEAGTVHNFKWTLDQNIMELKFDGEEHHFYFIKINEKLMNFLWQEKENALVLGCRR
jgi:hypothetical protein